jgi:hypothetical protein
MLPARKRHRAHRAALGCLRGNSDAVATRFSRGTSVALLGRVDDAASGWLEWSSRAGGARRRERGGCPMKLFQSLMMVAMVGLALVEAPNAAQAREVDAAEMDDEVTAESFVAASAQSLNGCSGPTFPLHRYWSLAATDHFYTIWFSELGWGKDGYVYEGTEGSLLGSEYQACGAVPLYRYWSPGAADHFYTTNFGELGYARLGYTYEGVQGHCFPFPVTGTKPLYRFVNDVQPDHFYTTRTSFVGGNYRLEGIACYVAE